MESCIYCKYVCTNNVVTCTNPKFSKSMGSNLITLDGDPSNFICDMFQPKVTNFNDINFRKISKKKGEK